MWRSVWRARSRNSDNSDSGWIRTRAVQVPQLDFLTPKEHHELVRFSSNRPCALVLLGLAFACSDGSGQADGAVVPASTPSSAPMDTGSGVPTGGTPNSGGAPAVPSTPAGGGATAVPSPTAVPTVAPTAVAGAGAGGSAGEPGLGTGGGGGSAGAGEPEVVARDFLSQTGLYADIATETLAERVVEFAPRFTLWTDGATKRRWLHIPEGSQIDTSDIDEWKFPVGTKVWKEFSRDGVRVETRLIEKLPPERASEGFEGWLSIAYIWNEGGTDAEAAPMGQLNARGTEHDVPDQEACGRCHDMRVDKPLGVSAVQLNHSGEGATLESLLEAGWLSDPPAVPLTVPGDEVQQAVLGYLHANCGHCHRERAPANNRVQSLRLWLESEALGSVEETEAYRALVNQYSESGQGSLHTYRVVGGDPDNSEVMRRITVRQGSAELDGAMPEGIDPDDVPMPPLGTELPDEMAIEMVRNWIASLPAPTTPSIE